MAIDQDVDELLIMGDSDLIIWKAQGEWETRDVKLIPYWQHVEDLSKLFKLIKFRYIPRCHNELADALATLASMLPYPGNAHTPWKSKSKKGTVTVTRLRQNQLPSPGYHDIKRKGSKTGFTGLCLVKAEEKYPVSAGAPSQSRLAMIVDAFKAKVLKKKESQRQRSQE
ncbi:PREDICTED: uncharacterized protein LOC109225899 [Nicotiana attenuata]|uniref:uncharacterized protein LOC109225899 n=1 Tax=Nicotiana attenuata TaxID=49451 RepID=UPI000904DA4F|nr:PREDICTED: uncharacterized protein LOC109225899 [Nicotiana attenuata]